MKPTKQEMLEFIYEKVANKDLSFGCRVIINNNNYHCKGAEFILVTINDYSDGYSDPRIDAREYMFYREGYNTEELRCFDKNDFNIKGHPVMIGDVLDYIENSSIDIINIPIVCKCKWRYKRKPIDDQSYNCIKYFYNLLKEYETTR